MVAEIVEGRLRMDAEFNKTATAEEIRQIKNIIKSVLERKKQTNTKGAEK